MDGATNLRSFSPKERYVFPEFILRELIARDARDDYKAIKSNAPLLRKLLGTSWPPNKLAYEENLRDIARHEIEFDQKRVFTYGVWDKEEKEYLGCL